MNIKALSLKKIFNPCNIYEQEIDYGGILGQAELFGYKFVCFRKANSKHTSAIDFIEVEHTREIQIGNRILEHAQTNLRFGKKINKIMNNENIEEIYGVPLFSVIDDYFQKRYNYLISPELFISIGIDSQSNRMVSLEVMNDKEMISELIEYRK